MKLAESINELDVKNIIECWNNARIIHEELKDFLDNSLYSVYDDNGFEWIRSHTSPHNFIESDMYVSIWAKFMNEELWDNNFEILALGVMDPGDEKPFQFYTNLSFADKFEQDYFKKNSRANKIIDNLVSLGWEFEFDEENELWYLYKSKPIENFDFTKPSWKKDLKRFFEDCLTELSDTIFVTKNWLV